MSVGPTPVGARPVWQRAGSSHRLLLVLAALPLLAVTLLPPVLERLTQAEHTLRTRPGERRTVELIAVAPAVPGDLDLVLVLDQTGSYDDDLPAIRSLTPQLVARLDRETDLRFGLVGFDAAPNHKYANHQYEVHVPITSEFAGLQRAVDRLSASGGGDEIWLTALDQTLLDFTFRPDAQVVVLVATDEPSIELDGVDESVVAAAYRDAGIRLIGLVPHEVRLDQLEAITAATEGTIEQVDASSTDLDDAVLRGLETLPVDIEPELESGCPVEDVVIAPRQMIGLKAGTEIPVTVEFTVLDSAPAGETQCTVALGADGLTFVLKVER